MRKSRSVDVAEILRRWTHALQRIHKQSLHLWQRDDKGDGPGARAGEGCSGEAKEMVQELAPVRLLWGGEGARCRGHPNVDLSESLMRHWR